MFYSIKRVLNNIKKHFVVNILIIIELIIGLGVLLGCFNLIRTKETSVELAKQQMLNKSIRISYLGTYKGALTSVDMLEMPYVEFLEKQALNYNSYLELKKQFEDIFEVAYSVSEYKLFIDEAIICEVIYINNEQFSWV